MSDSPDSPNSSEAASDSQPSHLAQTSAASRASASGDSSGASAGSSNRSDALGAPWRRSRDAVLAGVCAGIAQRIGAEPWVVRSIWAFSILCFGTGIALYAVLWVCMPRGDDRFGGLERMLLGVCARIARRGDVDIAVARLIAIALLFLSGGAAIVGYVVLYFLLPEKNHGGSQASL